MVSCSEGPGPLLGLQYVFWWIWSSCAVLCSYAACQDSNKGSRATFGWMDRWIDSASSAEKLVRLDPSLGRNPLPISLASRTRPSDSAFRFFHVHAHVHRKWKVSIVGVHTCLKFGFDVLIAFENGYLPFVNVVCVLWDVSREHVKGILTHRNVRYAL